MPPPPWHWPRQEFGSLDILVNNAGYGLVGAIEEVDPQEYRPMFETNVFGLIETTRAALPALRRTGGGRIVNVSSVGGLASRARASVSTTAPNSPWRACPRRWRKRSRRSESR